MRNNIDNQLWNLHMTCIQYVNPIASWVYQAIARYINTGRSSHDFESKFSKLNSEQLSGLIDYCFKKDDMSDDGIVKAAKTYINRVTV